MKKISCMIVDDEDLARALIENHIGQLEDLELVASCDNPVDAFNLYSKNPVDLLFLDIQMPEMKGTTFMTTLQPKPMVVFTTAYSDYALESYELEAIDYLLKPVRFDRFLRAMQKVRLKHKMLHQQLEEELAEEAPLQIKSGYEIHQVAPNDITFIEGMKEYVAYHTLGKRIMSYQTMKSLETSLPADRFVRIHRSYIVNKKHIKSITSKQITIGERVLPVGNSYVERVKEKLLDKIA